MSAGKGKQLAFEPTYLLDSCCVIDLENTHRTPNKPPHFNEVEQEAIWNGLETLASEGYLKIIKYVRQELTDWHIDSLNRLLAFKETRLAIPRSIEVIAEYRRIVQLYPDLIRKRKRSDPADPWLVTVAHINGYHVLTEELDRQRRSGAASKDLRIPDVCQLEGIQCYGLRKLANDRGWIR